jgi:WD40 repeat protein
VAAVFLNPRTGKVLDTVPVGKTAPGSTFGSSVAVSPDRTKVAVTYGYGTVVLDTRTRRTLARIVLDRVNGAPERVWASVWSADGSRLLLSADGTDLAGDGSLAVVDTATWTVLPNRVDIGESAQSMELSPDGRWLALAMTIPSVNDAPPGSVHLLDARTLQLRRVLPMERGEFPFDVSFSGDGRRLAAGSDQGTLSVFDVASGVRLHDPARVQNGMIEQVEWLPDAKTLVTAGQDGMVTMFDAEQGLILARLPGSSDGGSGHTYVTSVAADKITALTDDRAGRTYSLDLNRWLDYACVVAGRNLTRDEWSTYLPERTYQHTCGNFARPRSPQHGHGRQHE